MSKNLPLDECPGCFPSRPRSWSGLRFGVKKGIPLWGLWTETYVSRCPFVLTPSWTPVGFDFPVKGHGAPREGPRRGTGQRRKPPTTDRQKETRPDVGGSRHHKGAPGRTTSYGCREPLTSLCVEGSCRRLKDTIGVNRDGPWSVLKYPLYWERV